MEPIGAPHFRGGSSFRNGELVALTGRQKGLRRPLSTPLTFVGRAAVCDVRLNVPGIDPFHCLFVHVPTGLMVRDLNSSTGTFINGQRVSQVTVHDGDTLAVGALQFLIRIPPDQTESGPPHESSLGEPGASATGVKDVSKTPVVHAPGSPESVTDALRVQAAAVAAQHAAITEEEIRLNQRQEALQAQEIQLSERLEHQRQELESLQAQTQLERDALKHERADYEDFVALVATCLTTAQKKLVRAHQEIECERRRLADVAVRMRKRNEKLLAGKMEELAWREEQLANEMRNIESEATVLANARQAFEQERVHHVTEYELGRRRLAETWRTLRQSQSRWHKRRRLERTALNVRARDLDEKLHRLSAEARQLHDEKRAWTDQKQLLQAELSALNQRIQTQRAEWSAHSVCGVPDASRGSQSGLEPDAPARAWPSALAGASGSNDAVIVDLQRLSTALADQRRELAEHWHRLSHADEAWDQERRQALAVIEGLTKELQDKERTLTDRARTLDAEQATLLHRREELGRLEEQIAARQAHLRLKEVAWESERNRLLADVQHREDLARRQSASVTQVLEGWNRRRAEELRQLRADRQESARLYEEYLTLRTEWQRRNPEAPDYEVSLVDELAALDRRFREAEERLQKLWAQRGEFEERVSAWEQEKLQITNRELQLDREVMLGEQCRLRLQDELAKVREVAETLAHSMLGDVTGERPQEKAA